jgi:hypothetical protein
MAVGDVATDHIEKTTLTGVATCSDIRNGTDTTEARMKESERGPFPDNVHISFTRADFVGVLLGAIDLRHDTFSIEQVAALADKIADLVAGLDVFRSWNGSPFFTTNDI